MRNPRWFSAGILAAFFMAIGSTFPGLRSSAAAAPQSPAPGIGASARAASVTVAGGTVIAWEENRRGVARVFAQRLDAAGVRQWPDTGLIVSDAPGGQTVPVVILGAGGVVIVAWLQGVPGGMSPYAQTLDVSGARLWGPNGIAAGNAVGFSTFVSAASDGHGGVVLAWDEFIGTRIHAQRVSAAGQVLWNGGTDVVVCNSSGLAINPSVGSDGAGGAIVTWQDYVGTAYDIFAARVDSSGTLPWTANGAPICTATRDQWYPHLASDGVGGAIITWQDYRTGVADIYAQHVNPAGVPQWTIDGTTICTAIDQQYQPVIIADATGGAIIAWQDYRAGGIADIYAQRVTPAGLRLWGADGLGVSTAPDGQYAPALLSA